MATGEPNELLLGIVQAAIPIIEDDAYALLPRQVPLAIAMLAPDFTYYITGFSKTLGAGLRNAYVRSPGARQSQRLAGALRATTVMASPITNALATLWVEDGTADAMLQAIRNESTVRQAMAARHLATHGVAAQSGASTWWATPQLWPKRTPSYPKLSPQRKTAMSMAVTLLESEGKAERQARGTPEASSSAQMLASSA